MATIQQRLQAAFVDIVIITALSIITVVSLKYAIAISAWLLIERGISVSLPFTLIRNNLTWASCTVVAVLYGGISESSRHQATLGKWLNNCFVERSAGEPLRFIQACKRQIYKVLPFFFLGGVVLADYFSVDTITEAVNINIVYYAVLSSPLWVFVISFLIIGTTLHDRLAGTYVIVAEIILEEDDSNSSLDDKNIHSATT